MNQVCLIGRLTTKPELKQTSNGIATTRFNLAVNRVYSGEQKQTDFIPVQVWRKQAENVCRYLDKGNRVSIEGRIQVDSYTDKENNKRNLTYVVADNVEFLENKKSGQVTGQVTGQQSGTQTPQSDTEQVDIYSEFGDEIDDNYLD